MQIVRDEGKVNQDWGMLQYKFIFVQNYLENESVVIFKTHHTIADGIGNVHFL